jgi:hypothetical protein
MPNSPEIPSTPQPEAQSPAYDSEEHLRFIRARQAKEDRRDEIQLDTEELHAQLSPAGFSRLRHPFRNARIVATILHRQMNGTYDLQRSKPAYDPRVPWREDELDLKRLRRQRQKEALEREQDPNWRPWKDD